MAVELEGLEFQIEAKSTEASKGIESLISSFSRLKNALSGKGLDGLSTKLDAIDKALNSASIGKLEGLTNALSGLNTVKISAAIPARLSEIGTAIETITADGVSRIERLSTALRKLDGIKIPNLSQISRRTKTTPADREPADGSAQDAPTEIANVTEEISRAAGASGQLKMILDRVAGTASKVFAGIDSDFAKAFPGFGTLAAKIKPLGAVFSGLTGKVQAFASAHPAVSAALLATKAAAESLLTGMKKLGSSAFSTAKTGFEALKSSVKQLESNLVSLSGSALKGLASDLKSIGKYLVSDFTKPFTRAVKSIVTWKNAIGRIAYYRAVRSAIKMITDGFKTGIENLYQYSRLVNTEFAPAMNSLATSALYLKNSLGAMAAPLVQALAPAIDFLIDKFVALLNVIGKVFAALTGKSVYTQAKKQAVEYGDAAGNASKATKDFLLGIDELNVISDKDSGGSGGGTDFGSMFEEVEVPSDITDWANKIREAIDNGDWRGVGEILGDKLNDIIDKWDAYGWGKKLGELINRGLNIAYGFLKTFDFEKLGRRVAELLNGIFDTVDFDLLGRVFAAKWNALFDFIYGFATTLKWHEIGLHIAEAVNGFLDEIDTVKAALAISAFVNGLFDMLNTAIREIHWDVLGQKLAAFINNVDWYGAIYGALSIITNSLAALKMAVDAFIAEWDWRGTAEQIYTAINHAFSDVDWYGLGQTLGESFKTVFDFLRKTIAGIDWYEIGKDIAQFLNGIDWLGTLSSLASAIAAGINAAIKAVKGFIDNVNVIEIATSIGNSINRFFSDINWEEAGKTLSDGIEKALDFMITFMQTVDWDAIGRNIASFFESIDWDTLLTKWGQLMGEFINAKLELIDVSGILTVGANIVKGLLDGILAEISTVGLLGWLKDKFIGLLINGVKNLLGIHSPSTVFIEIGKNIVAGLLEGLLASWEGITGFFAEKWEALKNSITETWQSIHDKTAEVWENIKTTLSDTWENLKEGAKEKFDFIKEKITGAWDTIKTKTSDTWKLVKNNLSTTWENLKTNAQTAFDGLRTNIEGVWEKVKTTSSTLWNNITSTLSSTWESLKGTANTKFTELRTNLDKTWETLKTNAFTLWDEVKTNLQTTKTFPICGTIERGKSGVFPWPPSRPTWFVSR